MNVLQKLSSQAASLPTVKPGVVGVVTAAFIAVLGMWESGSSEPVLIPYKDVRGVWTVCHGITNASYPEFVVPSKRYSKAECTAGLEHILNTVFLPGVSKELKVEVTGLQYLMLVDFAYNAGLENYRKSTLLKKLNAGQCYNAGQEFKRWVYSGGQKYPGLVRRAEWRGTEFLTGCGDPVWLKPKL